MLEAEGGPKPVESVEDAMPFLGMDMKEGESAEADMEELVFCSK